MRCHASRSTPAQGSRRRANGVAEVGLLRIEYYYGSGGDTSGCGQRNISFYFRYVYDYADATQPATTILSRLMIFIGLLIFCRYFRLMASPVRKYWLSTRSYFLILASHRSHFAATAGRDADMIASILIIGADAASPISLPPHGDADALRISFAREARHFYFLS